MHVPAGGGNMFNMPHQLQRWLMGPMMLLVILAAVVVTAAVVDVVWLRPGKWELTLLGHKFSSTPMPDNRPTQIALPVAAYRIAANSTWWPDVGLPTPACLDVIDKKITEARALNAMIGASNRDHNAGVVTVPQGDYVLHFRCITQGRVAVLTVSGPDWPTATAIVQWWAQNLKFTPAAPSTKPRSIF